MMQQKHPSCGFSLGERCEVWKKPEATVIGKAHIFRFTGCDATYFVVHPSKLNMSNEKNTGVVWV